MSFTLVFCADGHLRVRNGKNPLVPLKTFQEESGRNDLAFMASWWEEPLIFEQGLTIGTFLNGLAPWADFWSDFLQKDVGAYIAESKKPVPVEKDRDLWYAMLSYVVEYDVDFRSNKTMADFDSFTDYLNDDTPPTILPFWSSGSGYRLSGYKKGEIEQYSIDHSPMNELAHMPLVLNHYEILVSSDFMLNKHGLKKQTLVNPKAIGLRKTSKARGKQAFTYVLGERHHRLRDVVEAFFWWFARTPEGRDRFNDVIHESVEALDRERATEKESTEETSKVVPISEDVEVPVNEETSDTDEPKKMKVAIAEGAFDGLIAHSKWEDELFAKALSRAKKSRATLKIGKVQEQPLPEKRVFGYIVEDEDFLLSRRGDEEE